MERPALICKGELLLDLRYFRNTDLLFLRGDLGELLPGLPYLRNQTFNSLAMPRGELLPELRHL